MIYHLIFVRLDVKCVCSHFLHLDINIILSFIGHFNTKQPNLYSQYLSIKSWFFVREIIFEKKWGNMCSSTYQFSLSSPDIASNFWLINQLSTLINWWLWLKHRLYSGCLASSTSRVRATCVMYLWRVTDCDSWSMETIQGVFFDLKPTADL